MRHQKTRPKTNLNAGRLNGPQNEASFCRTQDTRLKTVNRQPKTGNRPPLTEGTIPLTKNGHRDWKSMSDKELVSHAKNVIVGNKIGSRTELGAHDRGLLAVLRRRNLLNDIGLESIFKNWISLANAEILRHAEMLIKIEKIESRKEFADRRRALYAVLSRRNLLGRIRFRKDERSWSRYEDDELVEYTKNQMKTKKIRLKVDLLKTDASLHYCLSKRGLLGKLDFDVYYRDLAGSSDSELVKLGEEIVGNYNITRSEFKRKDLSLYKALSKRGLLGKLKFALGQRWASLSHDELVAIAREFIKKNNIMNAPELRNMNMAMYTALLRRKLVKRVFAEIEISKIEDDKKEILLALSKAAEAMEQFGERR